MVHNLTPAEDQFSKTIDNPAERRLFLAFSAGDRAVYMEAGPLRDLFDRLRVNADERELERSHQANLERGGPFQRMPCRRVVSQVELKRRLLPMYQEWKQHHDDWKRLAQAWKERAPERTPEKPDTFIGLDHELGSALELFCTLGGDRRQAPAVAVVAKHMRVSLTKVRQWRRILLDFSTMETFSHETKVEGVFRQTDKGPVIEFPIPRLKSSQLLPAFRQTKWQRRISRGMKDFLAMVDAAHAAGEDWDRAYWRIAGEAERVCMECGAPLLGPARKDRRYCSGGTCRARKHAREQRQRSKC